MRLLYTLNFILSTKLTRSNHINHTIKIIVLTCFLTLYQYGMTAQVAQIVPPECYAGSTPSQQDAAALADPDNIPFATWKAVHAYATDPSNSVTTVNFAPGTYYPGGTSGLSSDWGDAFGGFEIPADLTVNGNGAVIDNSANNNSIAFATINGNNASLDGFTFVQFTGNNAGAVVVSAGLTGWTISNCNFDHSDWAGDGLVVNQGSGATGTIVGCNFYGHIQSTGSAMTVNGPGGSLDILNSTYSCNSRIVAGGAVRILGSANVNFEGCTFDGNETNSASGGAISIEENSITTFSNTIFTCNMAIINVEDDGGAMHIVEGSDVTLNQCTFKGNEASDKGGAIHASGASASPITLNINSSSFEENKAITALSTGGAIYLNDTNAAINGSFFTLNEVTGEGGALYVDKGNNNTTYQLSDNLYTSNTASGPCSGIDVFTEMHITGTNNKLDHLADGNHLSEQAGSLEFTNGDDFDNLSSWTTSGNITGDGNTINVRASSTGSVAYASQQESGSGTLYWTFKGWTASSLSGLSSGSRAFGFVLGDDDGDFNTGNGFAIVKGRVSSSDENVEFISYSGGLYGSHSVIHNFGSTGSESGYITFKVVYEPVGSTWSFYWTNGSSTAGPIGLPESDPRGYNYCSSDGVSNKVDINQPFSLAATPYVGPFWSPSSTSSSNSATFDSYYFRAGDETDSNGASSAGSGVSASCSGCLTSSTAITQCPSAMVGSIQGDVFLDSNMDGIMNPGEQLPGVEVSLYDSFNTLIGTTFTDANGHYIFTDLPDGDYYVQFGVPSGFSSATSTLQNNGPSAFDSDIIGGVTNSIFTSPIITLDTSTGMSDGSDNFSGAANYYNVTAGYIGFILPVEFSFFSLNIDDACHVNLNWATDSELNNEKFILEKSTDGVTFEIITEVSGAGNSNHRITYTYKDKEVRTSKLTYYRITQIDYDGKSSHSNIITADRYQCEKQIDIKVYPTLSADGQFTIETSSNFNEKELVQVFNIRGKLVKMQELDNDNLNILNLEGLDSGIYIINFVNANVNHRVIIANK